MIGGGGVFVLNDPPEIDLDNSNTSSANYTQTFTPGSGGVNIADSDVAVTDVETNAPETTSGKEILSATITLTNRPDGNSAESLSLTTAVTNIVNDNNLTSSYNASTGELTINGPADLSVYESIIAGILYNNTEADPDTTSRIIEVVVNDGVENSNTAISTITFATPSNNPPTTSDESAETDEDAPYTFEESDFPFNDADGSDTLQTVKITSLPNNGKLQLNGVDVMDEDEISVADIQNGLLKFVPDPDENGTDYADFTFQVSDGQDFSSDRTFTIDVEPVNDEPTFSGLDNNPTFTPSGSAVILDSSVMVSDPELDSDPTNNYDGATLTLERDGGASDDDVFSNTGTLDPLTESGDLIVNDTIVGTVTTNNGGTLVLSFNNNATQALVNQVLQQITYANSSETPPNSVQLNYRFNDGNTGAQGSGDDSDGMGSIVVNIGSTTPGVETPPSGGSTPPTDPAVTSTPEPEITVSYSGSNDIPDGTSIPQNLGSHPVGDPIIETFTIENTGTADLVLDPGSLNLPNGFTLLGEFPESIDPGSSATFSVQLDTSTPGTFNGAIAFTTNDADEGTFDFPVEVVIAETPPEAAPNRPAVPVVSVTSVPPGPTESAIVPHADDDCCCPMAPTLEGVLVQPIAPFTLTALPDIDRVLLGTENHDSLLGGPVNDAIGGLAGNDRLDGFDGEDLLVGGLSSPVPVGSQFDRDTLYGNRGNDVILGNEGTDRIEAGQDDDVVFGGKDGDRIEGEMGDDTLLGEQGDDEILGGTGDDDRLDSGRDRIYGGDGNDRLYGNQGSDAISGGDGDDRLYGGKDGDLLAADLGNDTLKGEQGNDTLLGSLGSTNAIGNAGEKDWLSGNEGNDLIKGGEGEDTIYAGQDNDLAYGGKDNDRLYGDKGRDTLSGDLGDDTLFGGTQDPNDSEGISDGDLIFGGDGNDRLNGNRGNDSLVGGSGNDTASGGQEDDVLWGEAGNDWLYGDLGNDKLCGGDGNDTLIGSNGDPMNPEDGNDQLCGGAGNDRLYGNEGDDRLSGDAGEDGLYGGKGNDTLSGGDGTDVLSGEEGNDLLTGGAGGDRFDFAIGHGINTITDFTDGEDVIGLKGGFTFQELAIVQVENDTQITVGTLSITVQGVNANAISSEDFAIV